jgi:transcriptional regulator with XRE-family HTH domain
MKNLNRKIHFLGTKIKSLRKLHGYTLEDMIVRCMQIDSKHTPSMSYLSLIETGKRNPSKDLLLLLSKIFQKKLDWFLDDTIQDAPLDSNNKINNDINSISLEPNFLFSKEILKSAIPAVLSQTGTSGRQFAHILIRSYQEKNKNQFPDIERIAEDVGRKKLFLSVDDIIHLCVQNDLKIKWFNSDPFSTNDDSGRIIKTLFRSFYETPNVLYLNKTLKKEPARLKYDLACLLGHKILHNGDGILSSHATGGAIGGSPTPFEYKSSHIQQKDILYAWRDFECSYFAGALLCPKIPFRHFLTRESYNIDSFKKIKITPSVLMRRMISVSTYKHWHYFDAYPPGYLRHAYRGNGVSIPWGNMRLVTDPCKHWNIFKVLDNTRMKKSYSQLSLLKEEDRKTLYASISVRTKDAAQNPHVISAGIDLGPAIESQRLNKNELLNIIDENCMNKQGDILLDGEVKDCLLRVAKTLNISWVEDAVYNSCSIICSRSTNCPRPIPCEKHPSSKKNFSWLDEIKKEIINKGNKKK